MMVLAQGRVACGPSGFQAWDATTRESCVESIIVQPMVASDVDAGMFAWQNTTGNSFLITSAHMLFTTAPTVGTINIALGVAATRILSSSIYTYATLTTALVNAQNPRTLTVATAGQLVTPGQWITLSRTAGATAGMAGWVVIRGVFLGQLDMPSMTGGAGVCPSGRVAVPQNKGFIPYDSVTGLPEGQIVYEAPLATTAGGGGMFAWQNNTPNTVALVDLLVSVTTGSTGASTYSFGTAAAPNVTGTSFLSGINGQTVQVISSINPIVGAIALASGIIAPGQWVTGGVASGDATGMVARAFLAVVPLGVSIN